MTFATQTEKLDLRVSPEFKKALTITANKKGTTVKAIVLIAILGGTGYGREVRKLVGQEFTRLTKSSGRVRQ